MKKWEKELQSRIGKHYKIAYREMEHKFLDKSRLLHGQDTMMAQKLKDGLITKQEYGAWRITLESRLHEQVNTLAESLGEADKYAVNEANKAVVHAYAEGMNEQLYQVEKYGIKTSFTLVDDDAVSRAARGRFARNLNRTKNMQWNVRRIRSAITSGVLRGDSVPKIAKALLPVVNGNKKSAMRNAVTWVNSAENGGHYDRALRLDEAGIRMKKVWLSAGDERVRDSHRELDGEERYIEEPFSNGGMYPADPALDAEEYYNCRCTILNFPEGVDPDIDSRKMNIDESYEDWKAGKR